jgi:hypothetical protein
MNTLVATFFSLALLFQTSSAGPGRVVNLVLPRDLTANETVWLELKLGVLPRGVEVEVETADGKLLGVISPHGIRSGHEAGTYTLPVPLEAISDKRVSVRLILKQLDRSKRAPTIKEVKDVRLKITSPER